MMAGAQTAAQSLVIQRESQPYWDGLQARRLLIQRCASCGCLRHYPRPVCSACWSMAADWVEASGKGVVHTWTVAHHAFHKSWRDQLPLVLVTVDLDEGVRIHAPLRGPGTTALRIGLPVRLIFESTDGQTLLPAFEAADL